MRHKTPNQDHLHIRGEYTYQQSGEAHFEGSPPHTWRIRKFETKMQWNMGITSTYVENTRVNSIAFLKYWDHLHIRGEYPIRDSPELTKMGSPPHTWRIQSVSTIMHANFRITSTYVENTSVHDAKRFWARDHLHIRGEYGMRLRIFSLMVGSPPHTWRILKTHKIKIVGNGITSTYVENT